MKALFIRINYLLSTYTIDRSILYYTELNEIKEEWS